MPYESFLALVIANLVIFSTITVAWIIKNSPEPPPRRDRGEETAHLLARAQHARTVLETIHDRLCELHGVDRSSDAGDELWQVVMNRADYAAALERIRRWRKAPQ